LFWLPESPYFQQLQLDRSRVDQDESERKEEEKKEQVCGHHYEIDIDHDKEEMEKEKERQEDDDQQNNEQSIDERDTLLPKQQQKQVKTEYKSKSSNPLSLSPSLVLKEPLTLGPLVWWACFISAASIAVMAGFDELRPIFFEAPRKDGGLGLSGLATGLIIMVAGVSSLLLRFVVLTRMLAQYGAIQTIRYFSIMIAAFFAVIFFLHYITNSYAMWTVLVLAMFVRGGLFGGQGTSVSILVNNSTPSITAGRINGIVEAFNCLAYLVIFVFNGIVWSETYKLHSIFAQCIVFECSAIMFIGIFIASYYIPSSLDYPLEEKKTEFQ